MQVSDGSLNPELKGVGNVEIDGNKIKFAYSEMDTLLNKETLLFSVKLTGDFRTSNLRVDESFNNVVYGYDSALAATVELTEILYHASIK